MEDDGRDHRGRDDGKHEREHRLAVGPPPQAADEEADEQERRQGAGRGVEHQAQADGEDAAGRGRRRLPRTAAASTSA